MGALFFKEIAVWAEADMKKICIISRKNGKP